VLASTPRDKPCCRRVSFGEEMTLGLSLFFCSFFYLFSPIPYTSKKIDLLFYNFFSPLPYTDKK